MENQSTYRIRTNLGANEPITIPVSLMQEYNSFEILSLKLNVDETYRSYTSTEGIIVGRVSTQNNGLGIPNVRVSVFVPKGTYSQTDEEEVIYPFSSPTDMDGDRVRYNLLPSDSDVDCYQVIGTMPTKGKMLCNETVCDVFEKYYKYTTITNEAGDFMLTNIPVGKQRIHIDADLSDIGPFLSQRPYDMIENLGFDKNKFDSTRQFKTSTDLDSLAQVISQTKSVYVYPYWGDATENSSELKLTRTDLSLNYEFKTSAIFIGSVITDKQSNSLRQNCTAVESAGKMSDMVTGPGRIEMIRKTVDDKIEQYRIKGDMLINDNGVWCYMIPMNLDYVRTDEYGNIIPTDDPDKGVPTRARVRFRITMNQMDSDEDAHKRCSYLVPNNPKVTDEKFRENNDADYSFGSDTWDESFVDLFWNKVYTVKNYIPRLQRNTRSTNRKHTGIKMVNHYGDNNPFPYNSLNIRMPFLYRLICVIVKIIIYTVAIINAILSTFGWLPCKLYSIKILWVRPFGWVKDFIPTCIGLSADFCDDGINRVETYPGCFECVWDLSKEKCEKEQYSKQQQGEDPVACIKNDEYLQNCVENQLAQSNEVTSFDFDNDWINGCLYMPLWYRHIRPKKSFFFGLFSTSAKDQWCSSNNNFEELYVTSFCAHQNNRNVSIKNYNDEPKNYYVTQGGDTCNNDCYKNYSRIKLDNGVIVNKENMYGQKLWYYKPVEVSNTVNGLNGEYTDSYGHSMVSKLLYATDIVMLGSMSDCDLNGVPKFYNYLKASTFNLPTDILFTDTEIEYSVDSNGNMTNYNVNAVYTSVSSGCDWGNRNEYGYHDGGLFYSIGCASYAVDTPSCINLRRICELGVGLDEMTYVEGLNEGSNFSKNNRANYLRPDGYISYDDIIDFNYRSMFATMNGNQLKTKINTTTGIKEYDFRTLYIDNFDGSLKDFMVQEQKSRNANYNSNYRLEGTNKDYLTFRFGANEGKPYFYEGGHRFAKYENSFYFYFGLKEGKTAIDLFNEQYNGTCSTKSKEEEAIDYSKKANGWCVIDSENNYNHSTYDGFLTINLKDIPLPCTMMFNSKNNGLVSYTVCDENGETSIENEKICFYGNGLEEAYRAKTDAYNRYYLKYEGYDNGEGVQDKCYMLNNGTYYLYLIDAEGNQHSYTIDLNGKYLTYDYEVTSFRQSNNILCSIYPTIGQKYEASPYHTVAKTPSKNGIDVVVSEEGIPAVGRIDNDNNRKLRLNGTICVYNVFNDYEMMDKFLIEVEPYGKDNDGNYSDEDFWKSENESTTTWYCPKAICTKNGIKACTIENRNGVKKAVGGTSDSEYFYFYKNNETNEPYYIIKSPKGGADYNIKITQLCGNDNIISDNYIETKVTVPEPTPYKLYINDVDYDIIKKFNTGYTLNGGGGHRDGENVFASLNYSNVKGWLNISDVNNEYYDWESDATTYGKNSIKFTKEDNGEYTVNVLAQIKANAEPNEDDWVTTESFDEGEGESKISYAAKQVITNETYESLSEANKEKCKQLYWNEAKEDYDSVAYVKAWNYWRNGYGNNSEKQNWSNITECHIVGKNGDEYSYLCGKGGEQYVSAAVTMLEKRLEVITKMKDAFWIQCENTDKSVVYSVRTDSSPYQIWTIYNPEEEIENENYHLTSSTPYGGRTSWICKGEEATTISDIRVPTIASYDSESFGIAYDKTRIGMNNTYSNDKKSCFAQDNVASQYPEQSSVSIKPPYLVACVNSDGISKPEGLSSDKFFRKITNSYGLETYSFAEGDGYVKDNTSEFFGFHIIDKIFAAGIKYWGYMNKLSFYKPWLNYDDENILFNTSIKMEGVLSGSINNGISNITDEDGCVGDFTASVFGKEFSIKTYESDGEDSIPTRRCILFDKKIGETDEEYRKENSLTYYNYRVTTKNNVINTDQYRVVPSQIGNLSVEDSAGTCSISKTIYGTMNVSVLSTTLNDDAFYWVTIAPWLEPVIRGTAENGDVVPTLKVKANSYNTGTDYTLFYYIFRASQKESKETKDDNITWYPLNSIEYNESYVCSTDYEDFDGNEHKKGEIITKDDYDNLRSDYQENYKLNTYFSLDGKCDSGDESSWVWDGTTTKAPYFFNKNINTAFSENMLGKNITSTITTQNEEGEDVVTTMSGMGDSGIFYWLAHQPYYVVAVCSDGGIAISSVFDFHVVYYIAGVISKTDSITRKTTYYLRIGLVNTLRAKGCEDDNAADSNESYGVVDKTNPAYCKKSRNYHLISNNKFTLDYKFSTKDGDEIIDGTIDYSDRGRYGYFVNEKFTYDEVEYKVGDIITSDLLEKIKENLIKEKIGEYFSETEVGYKVIKDFTYDGKKYKKNDIVTFKVYNEIKNAWADEELSKYFLYNDKKTIVKCPISLVFNEKEIEKEVYDKLKDCMYGEDGIIESVHVTDYTKLKHKCKNVEFVPLPKKVGTQTVNEWNKWYTSLLTIS